MTIRFIPVFALSFTLGCGGGTADTTHLTTQVTELTGRLEANEAQVVAALSRIEGLETELALAQQLIADLEEHVVPNLPQAMTVTIEE